MEERQFRRKISWFQFTCCLLVIWNHSGNADLFLSGADNTAHPLWIFENGIMMNLVSISVPCFLMLSAYLFYRDFSWEKLPGKWKRRVRSLVIPYLFWNLLYYLAYLAASHIPYLDRIVNRSGLTFTVRGFLRAVFLYESNPIFWFMFQLILLTALAPVLYLVMKRTFAGILWLVLLMAGIGCGAALPWLNLDALTYYSLAAFCALHCRETAEAGWSRRRALAGTALVVLGAAVSAGYYLYAVIPCIVLFRLMVPAGLWLLTDEKLLPETRPWMGCTFFVYAFHFVPVRLITKLAAGVFAGSAAAALLLFLVMPAAAFAVCWQTAKFLRRFAPRLWRILNGGRGA